MIVLRSLKWAAAAAASAVLVVGYRFFVMSMTQAAWLESNLGYYLVVLAVAWFVFALYREQELRELFSLRQAKMGWFGIVVVVVGSAFLHVHEPHVFRVLNDEPSHVIGSMMMHEDRMAVMPAKVHRFFNGIVHVGNFPSFRLYLFQVLLSIIHDVSGYRAENVFVLNGILSVAFLALVYGSGKVIAGQRGGALAVILICSLPLLAQNVTSGGYDVLNLVLIAGLFLSTRYYLVSGGPKGIELMTSVAVLLALSRYESIVYLFVPVVAALVKWRTEREITLTFFACLSPILLLPCMAANYIMVHTDAYSLAALRNSDEGFFDIRNLIPHLRFMVHYLFSWDNNGTNSPAFSILGVISVFGFIVSLISRTLKNDRKVNTHELLLAGIMFITFGLYCLTLTNFWGMPTDVMAARFILPVHLIFAWLGVWFFRECWHTADCFPQWITVVAAVYVWQYTVPANSKHTSTNIIVGRTGTTWFANYARHHDNGRTLYVAQSDVPTAIYGLPSIQMSVLNEAPEKAAQALQAKLYDEILIYQSLWLNPANSTLTVNLGSDPLSPRIAVETVVEEKFAPDQIARIVRYKGVRRADGSVVTPAEVEPIRKNFKSAEELTRYYFDLLP